MTEPSLCPKAAEYAAMTDDEFESHVANSLAGTTDAEANADRDEPDLPDHIEMAELHLTDRCPECGEVGACAYDDLGRPLIHTTPKDSTDD